MSESKMPPGSGEIDETPGLAGGPGPTPPGVDDGTVTPRRARPEPSASPSSGAEQGDEAEAAERSAGPRRADVPGLADDREGAGGRGADDPAVREQERRTRR
jgi:hypothetical protein